MAENHIIPNLRGTSIGKSIIASNVFVGVGRTTPWENEEQPPSPTSDITELEELILYKRPDRLSFVIPDSEGNIVVRGQNYKAITIEEAYDVQSQLVLVQINFTVTDFGGEANYRQIGVFNHVIPKEGKENKTILLPAEIANPGYPLHIINRSPYYCYSNHGETINLLIAF